MMRSFWQGLVWGGLVVTVLGAFIGPMVKPQRKPLVERSADAVMATTRGIVREARHARKRLMKKID
ncbi:MAG TPA: hypothetical protein VGL27_00815 [Negativicutes bacterium]|jgi:hypothetical protein